MDPPQTSPPPPPPTMSSAAAAAAMASAAMAATTVDGLEVAGRNVEKMLHADSQFSGLQASCKIIFNCGEADRSSRAPEHVGGSS